MRRLNLFGGSDPRRVHSRMQAGFSARLRTVTGIQEVRLLDLSRSGARFVLGQQESIRDGILCWLQYEAFGGATRQRGTQVALKFDQIIPLSWLIETRTQAPFIVSEHAVAAAWTGAERPGA